MSLRKTFSFFIATKSFRYTYTLNSAFYKVNFFIKKKKIVKHIAQSQSDYGKCKITTEATGPQ